MYVVLVPGGPRISPRAADGFDAAGTGDPQGRTSQTDAVR
jgi:hypothetical protein